MKTLTLILFAVLGGSSGYLIKIPEILKPVRPASMGWIQMQRLLLPLFENVCEESTNPIIVRMAQEFNMDDVSVNYENPEAISNLKKLYGSNTQLAKGEIFTELNQDHMYELKVLYDGLYYGQSFDTFLKTAAWARQNVNCGLFVNAIYLAVLKRRETERITVPAPYELLPNYFIQQDVIIKASSLLAGDVPTEGISYEGNVYTLVANYTTFNEENDPESKLAYFREDIGLNSYFFLKRLQFAEWLQNIEDLSSNHGEYLYHFMKNLVARYNMELFSNGLMVLERVDWKTLIVDVYDPMLIFSNGEQFSERKSDFDISSPIYATLQNMEDNITQMVSPMIQKGLTKSQIINNLMAIMVTNLENYESVARKHFGGDLAVEKRWRSVLAHHMTTLRDPLYWKIMKKIVDTVDDVIKTLPSYQRNELYFPGVQIQNIEVKKVTTMFELFSTDVTDALKSSTETPNYRVNIVQHRLNHKPFTVKLNISSLVTQKGLVKLYLGPKMLPGEFAAKKDLFMLLDSFELNLKLGSNVISRSSDAFENISKDFTPINEIRKLIEDAEFGLDVQPLKPIETLTGFPSRLILPKGTAEGLPVQLLAFIAPFTKVTAGGISSVPKTEFNSVILSPGYPFDLDLDDKQFIMLPNVIVKDIIVTHKAASGYDKSGDGPKEWDGGANSASYGPAKEPFDYTLKKNQYGSTVDYAAKRGSYNKDNTDVLADPIPKTEKNKQEDKEKNNPDAVGIGTDAKVENKDVFSVLRNLRAIPLQDDYDTLRSVKDRVLGRNEYNLNDYVYE